MVKKHVHSWKAVPLPPDEGKEFSIPSTKSIRGGSSDGIFMTRIWYYPVIIKSCKCGELRLFNKQKI